MLHFHADDASSGEVDKTREQRRVVPLSSDSTVLPCWEENSREGDGAAESLAAGEEIGDQNAQKNSPFSDFGIYAGAGR